MQEDILPSVKKFLKTAKLVKIDYQRIDEFSSQLTEGDLKTSKVNLFSHKWTPKQIVNIITLFISQKKSPEDKPYHRTRTIFY